MSLHPSSPKSSSTTKLPNDEPHPMSPDTRATNLRLPFVLALAVATASPTIVGCDQSVAAPTAQTTGQAAIAAPQFPLGSSTAGQATPGQAGKPRPYKVVLPGVYPGAKIAFPPLGEFVQGEQLRGFNGNEIVVIEFFSTTCGHCEEAAPTVEALVGEFAPKGFRFISVTDEDGAKVREWLAKPEHAEMVKHSVALDPNGAVRRALQDPTHQVLNPRFFVLRAGEVLWYGHPDVAAEPFAAIAAGTWNPATIKQEFVNNALLARAKSQTSKLVERCEKGEAGVTWKDAFDLFDSIAAAFPDNASTFELQKFGTMIGPANMPVEGYALGKDLAKRYATDIAALRTLARTTLNSPRVQLRDLEFAFAIARAADTLGKGEDARAAEIMALAYFSKGDRENAIANQERAIRLQDNEKLKKTYEAQLAKYRKDEPKPVPYTPRPTPGVPAKPVAPAAADTKAADPDGTP